MSDIAFQFGPHRLGIDNHGQVLLASDAAFVKGDPGLARAGWEIGNLTVQADMSVLITSYHDLFH